jgi:hypothetical protein
MTSWTPDESVQIDRMVKRLREGDFTREQWAKLKSENAEVCANLHYMETRRHRLEACWEVERRYDAAGYPDPFEGQQT